MKQSLISISRALSNGLVAVLVGVILGAACVSGGTQPDSGPLPSPLPSASAVPTQSSPTLAAAPTFLVLHRTAQTSSISGGRLAAVGIRFDLALLTDSAMSTLDTDVTSWALSPDASRIAYWRVSSAGRQPDELRVLAWTKLGAAPVNVTRLSGERGDAVAWSTDGRGLLYSVISERIIEPTTGRAEYTALRATEIEAASSREVLRRVEGGPLTPLAWLHRSGDFIAQDGPRIRIGGTLERELPMPRGFDVARVQMSADLGQALVLGIDGELALFSAPSGELLGRWPSPGEIQDIAAGPGRPRWAIALVDKVEIWSSSGPERSLRGDTGPATAFFSIDGDRVGRAAQSAAGARVQIWSVSGNLLLSSDQRPEIRPLAVK